MKKLIHTDKIKDAYFDYLFTESMIPYDEVCWLFDNLNEDAKHTLLEWYEENHYEEGGLEWYEGNHVDTSNTENI